MKVVVTGSRHWFIIKPVMDRLAELPRDSTVIHGGASGVDKLATIAARKLGLELVVMPADWQWRGRAAGPYRNRLMLDMKPDLVIAFHEDFKRSRGTKDCANEAKRRGIPIELIELRIDRRQPR